MKHATWQASLLLLLVAGCGTTPVAPVTSGGTQVKAQRADFFPSAPGTVWRYQVMAHPPDDPYVDIPGSETVEVLGSRQTRAGTVLSLRELDAFADGYRYPELTIGEDQLVVRNVTYLGPFADLAEGHAFELLHFPVVVGSKWDDGLWAGGILGSETVTVPAGAFQTYKVDAIGTYQQAYTVVGTYWIAPGTGIVKSDLNTPGGTFECALETVTRR